MKKTSHVFGWDEEPSDERPSEFSSTSYSQLSGFHTQGDAPRRGRARRRSGSLGTLVWVGLLMAVGLVALVALARYLRGG